MMDRVGQLEAQLKQAPSPDELAAARQQANELRGQLGQGTEQLKVSQDRVGQLEAQLKQAPSPDELASARQQANELRGQLGQATEQLKVSQDRVGQLEAQLKQAPIVYVSAKYRPKRPTVFLLG
jgi:exonuclease VII large subunit